MTPMALTSPAWRGRGGWGGGAAPPRVAGAGGRGAAPVRPVTGPVEPRQLERVDVQQRPRLGPLIAPRGLRALGAPLTRHAVTRQDLPDRRAMPAGQPRQAHRPVVRLRSGPEDRPLSLAAQRPRTRTRPRRPAGQTRQRDGL